MTANHLPSIALPPDYSRDNSPVTHCQVRCTAPNLECAQFHHALSTAAALFERRKVFALCRMQRATQRSPLEPIFSPFLQFPPTKNVIPSFNVTTQTRRFLTSQSTSPIPTPFPSRDKAVAVATSCRHQANSCPLSTTPRNDPLLSGLAFGLHQRLTATTASLAVEFVSDQDFGHRKNPHIINVVPPPASAEGHQAS